MSIRILTNRRMEGFTLHNEYHSSTGGSDDGMRRDYSYVVHVTYTFSFENEKREEKGWSYDLSVVKDTDDYVRNYDMTETEDTFEKNFNYIATVLRNRGIYMLNIPAYMSVKCEFYEDIFRWSLSEGSISTEPDENAIELSFNGRLYPVKDTGVISASELITRVSERDDERKRLMTARAIGADALLSRNYQVLLDSIPDELYGKKKLIRLKKVSVDDLVREGAINDVDIEQTLKEFLSRVEKADRYYPISTDGIERFIINLPDELRRSVLRRCHQTSGNLQMFRNYCPEYINWRNVKAEDYIDSDLDLMIQRREYAYERQQWEFIERCMEKPELEKKVIENAYMLGRRNFSRIADGLRTCTATDLLHSVIKYNKENLNCVDISDVSCIFGLEYAGLDKNDYQECLMMFGHRKCVRSVAFILKVGLVAGVGEKELVEMLLEKEASMGIVLHNCSLKSVYEKFNFAPGLAWTRAEEARREAEERRIAKEQADSNEKVVKLVQNSGRLSVRVRASYSYEGYDVCRLDDEYVGRLFLNEKRVVLVEGRKEYYLVDIERIKKLRNGVFHFDVLDNDAGYIIGPKGSRIRELTNELNRLGCQIRAIKIHTHSKQDMDMLEL